MTTPPTPDINYLVQSEARLRLLLGSVPQGLFVFDRRHLLVAAFKQPSHVPPVPGLVEGRLPDETKWGAANISLLNAELDLLYAGAESARLTLRFPAAPGDPSRLFAVDLSRMDDFFVLAGFRDITEDDQAEARREADVLRKTHANKQESLSLLAAGIAHDVNNVLAVVLNTAETTWIDAEDEKTLVAVDTIRDAVRRGTSMMRELMTFAGESRGNLKRIEDPTSLVRESSRLVRGVVGPAIVLSYDLPAGLPAIDADPNQFWKIFFNFIKNAGEAMKDHPGEIHIAARAFEMTPAEADTFTTPFTPRQGKGVLYSVADNGPGIPENFIRRIFDPYISSKSANRGLGLAIVSSIVESHGGGIRVRSSEGLGTVFDVFVPVSRQPAPPPPAPPATTAGVLRPPTANAAPDAAGKPAILIIDDEPNIIRTTTILLQALGYQVHAASNSHDAVLHLRAYSATLHGILMDAHLGDVSTVSLLRAIRIAAPRIPVILLSGASEEKVADMFTTQPYDAFLAKPFTFAELKGCLDRLKKA